MIENNKQNIYIYNIVCKKYTQKQIWIQETVNIFELPSNKVTYK